MADAASTSPRNRPRTAGFEVALMIRAGVWGESPAETAAEAG